MTAFDPDLDYNEPEGGNGYRIPKVLADWSLTGEGRLATYGKGKRTYRPHLVVPRIPGGSPPHQRLVTKLMEELPVAYPASARDAFGNLVYPGIVGGWGAVRSLQGVPHTPPGIVTYQTIGAREVYAEDEPRFAGTHSDLRPDHRALLVLLIKVLFSGPPPEPVAMWINILSSTGAPYFSKDWTVSQWYIDQWLEFAWLFAGALERGDLHRLEELGMGFMVTMGARFQPEVYTQDPDGTLRGRRRIVIAFNGSYVRSDPSLPPAYSHLSSIYGACRFRKIAANPRCWIPARAACTMVHARWMKRFPKLWIFKNPHDMTIRLRNGFIYLHRDAPNHDVLLPWELVALLCDAFAPWFGEGMSLLLWALQRSPVLVSDGLGNRKVEGYPGSASVYDLVNAQENGSGHPGTSLFAKLGGLFYDLIEDVGLGLVEPTVEDIERWLSTEHPNVDVGNAGDNSKKGYAKKHSKLMDRVIDDANRPVSERLNPYTVMKRADTMAGAVICSTPSGLVYVANLDSSVVGTVAPGRAADDPQRGSVCDGYPSKWDWYKKYHPLGGQLKGDFERICQASIGVTMEQHLAATSDLCEHDPSFTSEADILFASNPDIIYTGRVDENEISEKLREKSALRVPPDQVARLAYSLKTVKPHSAVWRDKSPRSA